ncbi:MAG: hypothetical protein RL394_1140 [Bacteroidota bacterium]|jgi:hypothetical protein
MVFSRQDRLTGLDQQIPVNMRQEPTDELEDLLKERSDQYLLYPSDRVWNNIHKELHPNRTLRYGLLVLFLFLGTTTAIVVNKEKASFANSPLGQVAAKFIERDLIATIADGFAETNVSSNGNNRFTAFQQTQRQKDMSMFAELASPEQKDLTVKSPEKLEIPALQVKMQVNNNQESSTSKEDKKNSIGAAIETVIEQAKKIKKNASWQIYATPTMGYRRLNGEASRSIYQYSVFSLSTNAVFARNVKDAVSHKPGMGFEIGTAMLYPISKKLNFKAGLQANYNHYQIEAFSTVPEIANYGMNNYAFGSYPISAVSFYRNNSGYSPATLRNEHYMISMPIGIEYEVAGTRKLNFSVASSLQPTYVFANYSYLLSTDLKHYAKEPTLNRRWNMNAAIETNLNMEKGGFKWSIAPQFRYQMLSSFKSKYPIKENLMDFGIKVGVIKTIK